VEVDDVIASFEERDLDVGVLAPFLGEDFDPDIVVFVRGAAIVVTVDLPVKDHGWRTRSEGFAGHLEFIRVRRLKAHECLCGNWKKAGCGQNQGPSPPSSGSYSTK
jgi:hypothetical protein